MGAVPVAKKWRRSERVAAILKTLVDHPGTLFSLGQFGELLNSAKSTVSEDLSVIREALESFGLGEVETLAGAAGGVRYFPHFTSGQTHAVATALSAKLSVPERVLPGGYLYTSDVVFSPQLMQQAGEVMASHFRQLNAGYILTVETKGIPLALMTARALNLPLVILRRDSQAGEGSTVSINYVSGSTRRLSTMSLPKRALPGGARVIFIDDFLKGGGTAHGAIELMAEFDATVAGIGVLMETAEPERKLVDDYFSILRIESVDEDERIARVAPSPRLPAAPGGQ